MKCFCNRRYFLLVALLLLISALNIVHAQDEEELQDIGTTYYLYTYTSYSNFYLTDEKSQIISFNMFNESTVENNTQDVGIMPSTKEVTIRFKGLNLSTVSNLRFSDIPTDKVQLDRNKLISQDENGINKGIAKAFAIDPTLLDFENASLTTVAQGTELYKCRFWDFYNQICIGTWEKVMDLNVGEEYTIPFSKSDPGYAETVTATHMEFHNHGYISNIEGYFGDEFFQDGATYSNSITLYTTRRAGYRFNLSSTMSGKTVSGFRIFVSARAGAPPATYNVRIYADNGAGLPVLATNLCNATFATPAVTGWVATGAASGGTCALSTGIYYHVIVNATAGGGASNYIQIGYTARDFRSDALYESYTVAGGWVQTAVSEPIIAIAFSDGTYYGNTFTTRTNQNIYADNYAAEYFETSALGFYVQNFSFSMRCLSATDPADDLDLNISYAGNDSSIFNQAALLARQNCSGTGYFPVTLNLTTPIYIDNNTAFKVILSSPGSAAAQYYRVDESGTVAAAPYSTISFNSTDSYFSDYATGVWTDDTASDIYFTFQLLADTTPPIIVLDNPPNNTWTNNNTIIFYYNVSDNTKIDNCTLILNGTRNTTSDVNRKFFYPGNFTLNNVPDGDYLWTVNCTDRFSNQGTNSSWKLLHIDTTRPNVYNVIINTPVTLTAGSVKTVTCNATINETHLNTTDAKVNNATLYFYTNTTTTLDNNNSHYTNNSCTRTSSSPFYNLSCSFTLYYYANNGTWRCNVSAYDKANNTGYNSTNIVINPLYAVNITDGINYGDLEPTNISENKTANITNFGNMAVNVTVEGYAVYYKDNNSMNCTDLNNISVGYEKFSTNPATDYASKTALTNYSQYIPALTVQKQTIPGTQIINVTYWQLQVPPMNIQGICFGYIIFSAEAP